MIEGSFAIDLVHLPTGFRHDRRGETHHLALVHRPRVVVHRLGRFGHQSVAALQRVGVRADLGHVRRRRRALHRRGTRPQGGIGAKSASFIPSSAAYHSRVCSSQSRSVSSTPYERPSDLELAPMVKRATSAAHRILARGTNADAVPPSGSRQLLPPQSSRTRPSRCSAATPRSPPPCRPSRNSAARMRATSSPSARRRRRVEHPHRGEESEHSTVQLEKLRPLLSFSAMAWSVALPGA